ncbi:chorismate mutase [Paenibacillus sp. MY03]|jgi:chorismate mutase|uniref:chorismate mutase n=1 Tax=Paenibacillus agaridevorans TaxID=171404 RepID=A0A2R5F0W7_9BACL|nr:MULTISPECIES: chorismate mutase [Paenibacillus]OUS77365.1 chorismate mutase [Paenibacillus sp. MY03]GBG12025.1 chorismate mutase [Paenibacillus agaridevorans]
MSVRGIRGAVTVEANEASLISEATLTMVREIMSSNDIDPADICSVLITVTQDLDDSFPAQAVRQLPGWELVPLMCALEVPVKGSLERCVRLMVLVNTEKSQKEIHHVYLGGAQALRPDLAKSKV